MPKTAEVYKTAGLNITSFTEEDYTKIYDDLASYAFTYRDENNPGAITGVDEWYEGCGLELNEYEELKMKMLKSIYENGGFHIGKYEVGIKEDKVRNFDLDATAENPINETPVIQANKIVYNWVRISQAQKLSERLAIGKKTSSLMFGIQWDLVLKYIESQKTYTEDGTLMDQTLIKSNSTKWGNYSNATFKVTNINAKYSEDDEATYIQVQDGGYQKPNSSRILTTGATERNSVAGIYDLAGNMYEWTLEKMMIADNPSSTRGGSYYFIGSDIPTSYRNVINCPYSYFDVGFRPALY